MASTQTPEHKDVAPVRPRCSVVPVQALCRGQRRFAEPALERTRVLTRRTANFSQGPVHADLIASSNDATGRRVTRPITP